MTSLKAVAEIRVSEADIRAWTERVLREAGDPKGAEAQARAVLLALRKERSAEPDEIAMAAAAALTNHSVRGLSEPCDRFSIVGDRDLSGNILHVRLAIWDEEKQAWVYLEIPEEERVPWDVLP